MLLFCLAQHSPAEQASDYRWAWVRKIDAGLLEDATATGLAVDRGGLWIGGEFAGKHYIQRLGLDGRILTRRILLGKGDSVNDLVSGPGGEVFGVADIHTTRSQRPGYFFARRPNGRLRGVRLATDSPNGLAGYADAYGIARSGAWVYATGYLSSDEYGPARMAYFGRAALDLSGINIPVGSYAAFLAKINSTTGAVRWVRFLDASSGESVKVGADGNVYAAGEGFDWEGPGVVRCLTPDGTMVWSNTTESFANSLALDRAENVWVSNRYSGSLQKFDRLSGNSLLVVRPPGAERSLAVGAHPSGGVVALFHGSWGGEGAGFRLYRIGPDGSLLWFKPIAGGLAFRGNWSKIHVSRRGEIYVALSAASRSDYDSSALFSRVDFQGFARPFALAANDESSKGFIACLRRR